MKKNGQNITYTVDHDIPVAELTSLYNSVGWTGYTDHPEKMEKILQGSLYHLSAWDDQTLVGLIRTVGDDASVLFIQDILVHPDYQRKQIGSTLVQSVLERFAHIRQTVLLTDNTEKTEAFYTSLGFASASKVESVAFIKMNWQA